MNARGRGRIPPRRLSVLVANEQEPRLSTLQAVLTDLSHEVTVHRPRTDASELVERVQPDVVLLGRSGSDEHSLSLVERFVHGGSSPVVALLASRDVEYVRSAALRGAFAHVVGTDGRDLEAAIGAAEELTALPQLVIRLAGRERTLLLDSFVCHLGGPVPALRCSPEIHSAFWVPVTDLWNPANLDHLALGDNGDTLVYPAVRLREGTVFGITLRVLTLLSDRLGVPLRYLEEIPGLRRGGTTPR